MIANTFGMILWEIMKGKIDLLSYTIFRFLVYSPHHLKRKRKQFFFFFISKKENKNLFPKNLSETLGFTKLRETSLIIFFIQTALPQTIPRAFFF